MPSAAATPSSPAPAVHISVLGAGAWGTALAVHLAQQVGGRPRRVLLWARDATLVERMQATGKNTRYLPEIALPVGTNLQFTHQLSTALAHVRATPPSPADSATHLLIIATSVAGLRPTLQAILQADPDFSISGCGVVWLCKGLEEGTHLLPHQVAAEVGLHVPMGSLSGPSFASEVAQGLPVALTLGTEDANFATRVVQQLHGSTLRVYPTDDVVGVEIGGALKNILAIATGIAEGLGLGLNARAALITRGLAEIMRYGAAFGARSETFMGLAGVGDLILTCTGGLSRNRKVGLLLAEGKSLDDILLQLGHVSEGVRCAASVLAQAQQQQIDMPIVHAVNQVLFSNVPPQKAIAQLLARDPAQEIGSRITS